MEIKRNGLGADGREIIDQNILLNSLKYPSWNRLFHIYDSFKLGLPFNTIQEITKIDKWFLYQIQEGTEYLNNPSVNNYGNSNFYLVFILVGFLFYLGVVDNLLLY